MSAKRESRETIHMINDKAWYAVYTRSRHEKVAADILRKSGIDHYLPLINVLSQWKDRKKLVKKPLFPGYLFVRITRVEAKDVLKAKGVVRVLGSRNDDSTLAPSFITDDQIANIRRLIDSGFAIDPYPYIKVGQVVRIKHGPLKGVEGTVIRKQRRDYLVINVDIIQKATAVELPSEYVDTI